MGISYGLRGVIGLGLGFYNVKDDYVEVLATLLYQDACIVNVPRHILLFFFLPFQYNDTSLSRSRHCALPMLYRIFMTMNYTVHVSMPACDEHCMNMKSRGPIQREVKWDRGCTIV